MANDGSGVIDVAIDVFGYQGQEGLGSIDVAVHFDETVNGIYGNAGGGSIDVSIGLEATGSVGGTGVDGGVLVAVSLAGSGVVGTIGSGSIDLSILISGPISSSGSAGLGAIDVEVSVKGYAKLGSIAYGSVNVEVRVAGSGYQTMQGSGSALFAVSVSGLGFHVIPRSVVAYSMNVSNRSVARHTTQYLSVAGAAKGPTYLAGLGGIYELNDSSTDNNVIYSSRIAKRGVDQGTNQVKSVTEAYLQISKDGPVTFIAEIEGGVAASVTVVGNVQYVHSCKVDLPRGMRGNYTGWVLESVAGSHFHLVGAEFITAASKTRRTRQARGQ